MTTLTARGAVVLSDHEYQEVCILPRHVAGCCAFFAARQMDSTTLRFVCTLEAAAIAQFPPLKKVRVFQTNRVGFTVLDLNMIEMQTQCLILIREPT